MSMKRTIPHIFIITLIFLSGCSALRQPLDTMEAIKKCQFTIEKVEPAVSITKPKITLSGIEEPRITISFNTTLAIKNPTRKSVNVNRFALNLWVDEEKFAEIETQSAFQVDPGKTERINVEFKADAKTVTDQIVKKIEGKRMKYRIEGTFYFNVNGVELPMKAQLTEGEG